MRQRAGPLPRACGRGGGAGPSPGLVLRAPALWGGGRGCVPRRGADLLAVCAGRGNRTWLALAVALAAVSVGSCRREVRPATQPACAPAYAFKKDYGAGPVRFRIELSSDRVTTADALHCRLTLRCENGFEAEFPDLVLPDDVPGLIATGYDERASVESGASLRVREFELEPEHAGVFRLPALQVYYHKADDVREELLETDPIEIRVEPASASADGLALKPMRGLITVERIEAAQRRTWPWIAGSAVAALAMIGIAIWWFRRPRPAAPPPPAHEVALEALRQLVAKDYIAAGRFEAFFVEITAIVREYIERAFGLHAPEQTTEEFLAGITRQPVVAAHRAALEPFLIAADEVKFARAVPDRAAIQRAFDTARGFVLQTSGAEGSKGA